MGHYPRLSKEECSVFLVGRALPELDPTKLAKMAPFYPSAIRWRAAS